MKVEIKFRQSEFQIKIIKYIGNIPVVVYEVTEPAEIYTLPSQITGNAKEGE